jgi:hypothetical protein
MSVSKKNLYKDVLLIILLLLSIAASIVFFLQNSELKTEIKDQLQSQGAFQSKFDSLLNKFDYLSKKSTADDYFIQGDYEKSFEIYSELVEMNEDKDLLGGRKNIFQVYMSDESKIAELQVLRLKEDSLFKEISHLSDSIGALQKSYIASIEQSKKQAQNLKVQFDQLEANLNSLKKQYNEVSENRNLVTFRSSSGNKVHYIGDMVNNRANGFGIGIWDTGGVYKGEWRNNRRNGKGRYEWVDGEWYEGNYADDQREGFGVYYKRNGERYEGNWKENKRHGEGKVYDKNEQIINEGVWNEDVYSGRSSASTNGNQQRK